MSPSRCSPRSLAHVLIALPLMLAALPSSAWAVERAAVNEVLTHAADGLVGDAAVLAPGGAIEVGLSRGGIGVLLRPELYAIAGGGLAGAVCVGIELSPAWLPHDHSLAVGMRATTVTGPVAPDRSGCGGLPTLRLGARRHLLEVMAGMDGMMRHGDWRTGADIGLAYACCF
jgi:hypothetical protein